MFVPSSGVTTSCRYPLKIAANLNRIYIDKLEKAWYSTFNGNELAEREKQNAKYCGSRLWFTVATLDYLSCSWRYERQLSLGSLA